MANNFVVVGSLNEATQSVVAAWQNAHRVILDEMAEATNAAAGEGRTGRGALRVARAGRALDVVQGVLVDTSRRSGQAATAQTNTLIQEAFARSEQIFGRSKYSFTSPSERAIRAIVERTQRRVTSRNQMVTRSTHAAIRDALVRSTAVGGSVDDTVKRMRGRVGAALGGGLARAFTIARTELIDANRKASIETYKANSDVMGGWRWLATLNNRTCAACWAMHNTLHPADEEQKGHPNCRCTTIPVLDDDETKGDLGSPQAKFDKLSDTKKRQILGPKRFELYQAGKADLADMASVRQNKGWRDSVQVTPVDRLAENDRAA